ncbi:ABC transporter substrate-binding protein [Enterovirga sp.]|uniref:ABC transporter substrate-binding protein n=1 Tax=Enterovirga sp. TaxID=2026350 RepID=UPI002C79CB83|nr:ABC transporter substrate-binding protein [Enterovirga sp.]HMO29935.1 ABC transporter substrate-binding protein [Enterovirga sp.]
MNWLRFLWVGLLLASAAVRADEDPVTRIGASDASARIVVWGSTDLDELRPVLEAFLARNPTVSIVYHSVQSARLYERIRAGRTAPPDLAISSAADLQIKLVNDGFALEHRPPDGVELPAWASWRSQAFGISIEPAVMVFHQSLAALGPLPQSRAELIQMLARHTALLDGKVATYDIEQSGLGYLFASQDSLYSTTFTTLAQALGRAHVRLFCCTGDILDEIGKARMLIGYNLLGSYAFARKQAGAPIEIVLPDDYTLILSRVALIPRGAARPDLSGALLDFLLSPEVQRQSQSLARYHPEAVTASHPIMLNPSLLVYLDPVKRSRFIKAWRSLVEAAAR